MKNIEIKGEMISVLMAVFNTKKIYLDLAIQSILNQSYQEIEFIIVNDGSNKNTQIILENWANADKRIKLFNLPENIGLTMALNYGLKQSSGKFIARQDSDDISMQTRLEDQYEFLSKNKNFDAVGTNVSIIDENSCKIGQKFIDPNLKKLHKRNILVHGSMMFRKIVFEVTGGYNPSMLLSQDYELYLRMIKKHNMKIGVLTKDRYHLRKHPDSLSSNKKFKQLYYSACAKNLTIKNKNFFAKLNLFLIIIYDLFITHHLFIKSFMK